MNGFLFNTTQAHPAFLFLPFFHCDSALFYLILANGEGLELNDRVRIRTKVGV